jgi:hypothetical protein
MGGSAREFGKTGICHILFRSGTYGDGQIGKQARHGR